MKISDHDDYDKFFSFSAHFSALFYGGLGLVLFLVLELFSVSDRTLFSVLAVYGIAAISHMHAYAAQSLNAQIKVCTDYLVEKLS